MAGIKGKPILRFDHLEERCVLATWPLPPVQGPLPIYATYGQWQEGSEYGMYFHEGIDIRPVDGGVAVYPVEDGTITAVRSEVVDYNSFMVVETNANVGWNYIHMVPGKDPNGNAWAAGAKVVGGGNLGKSQIGVVAATGGAIAQHLHLDYGGGVDPYLKALQAANPMDIAAEVAKVRRPIDDPLTKMPNLADTVRPTVEEDIHFRVAEHDRYGDLTWAGTALPLTEPRPHPLTGVAEENRDDNHYFKQDVVFFNPWRWVGALAPTGAGDGKAFGGVKHRIDILANIRDKIGDAIDADKVGVKKIGFSITGMGAQTGDILSFNFTGEFTRGGIIGQNPRPADQDYGGLRDYKQARVVYENDVHSDSIQGEINWHIVTNTPSVNMTAARVEEANRDRYWNSKVAIGAAWNDPGNVAAVNAQARFPDGFCRVNVWAEDAKSNKSVAVDKRVILDNFVQEIPLKPNGAGGTKIEKGLNFLPNSMVDIWVTPMSSPPPPDGFEYAAYGGYIATTVPTDSNGEFYNVDLGNLPYGSSVYADYNQDGWFISQVDAFGGLTKAGGEEGLVGIGLIVEAADDPPAIGETKQSRPAPSSRMTATDQDDQAQPPPARPTAAARPAGVMGGTPDSIRMALLPGSNPADLSLDGEWAGFDD